MPTRLALVLASAFALLVFLAQGAPLSRTPQSAVAGVFGSGPEIVLVPGLGGRSTQWLPVARNLARDHRVVLVDLPGHAASPMAAPLSLESATATLDEVLEHESAGDIVLVGHSVGGLLALAETVARPERVRALVLVETALRPQLSGDDAVALLRAFDTDYRGTIRQVYGTFGRDSLQGARLSARALECDSTTLRAWVQFAVTEDLTDLSERLRVPVLVVLGPHAWESGEGWAEVAQELGLDRIPRLDVARFEDCGHFIMLDRPKELAEAIRRFTARRGPPVLAAR